MEGSDDDDGFDICKDLPERSEISENLGGDCSSGNRREHALAVAENLRDFQKISLDENREEDMASRRKVRIAEMQEELKLERDGPQENSSEEFPVTEFSNMALTYYNQQNGLDFELVEFLKRSTKCTYGKMADGDSRTVHGFWHHINFMAKPKNDACSSDSSPRLFFAELCLPMNVHPPIKHYIVTACSVLESNDSGNCYECRFCKPERRICHPPHGFRAGFGQP